MAVKPQVKVAPEQRGETRIWNITDHPSTEIAPQSVMVLGRTLHPGRSMRVEESRLEKAYKVDKDVAAGLLFIGEQPPMDYQAFRSVSRARLPRGVARAHGETAVSKAKPPVKATVGDKVEVRDSMKTASLADSMDNGGKKKK